MSQVMNGPTGSQPAHRDSFHGGLPATAMGAWGLRLALFAVALLVALPVITVLFRDTFPITDTWIMPVIGLVMVDIAAVVNVLAVWRQHERSLVSLIAMALTLAVGIFVTMMVVGEGIAGV